MKPYPFFVPFTLILCLASCGGQDNLAFVQLKNDFNNPDADRQPPWTICHAWYNGTYFDDPIALGATSSEKEVQADIDYVYMIAAWEDPSCDPANALPIASREEEETLPNQTRTITIGLTNHQGPCPPEGVKPMSEELYNTILELWPEFSFKSYAEREQNEQCLD